MDDAQPTLYEVSSRTAWRGDRGGEGDDEGGGGVRGLWWRVSKDLDSVLFSRSTLSFSLYYCCVLLGT